MIRIAKGMKLLLMHHDEWMASRWEEEFAKTKGNLQALLIEAVEHPDTPLCPVCVEKTLDEGPAEGAGLCMCPHCESLSVALRLLGGPTGTVWYTFPWPR